jgi:hypothetical protein
MRYDQCCTTNPIFFTQTGVGSKVGNTSKNIYVCTSLEHNIVFVQVVHQVCPSPTMPTQNILPLLSAQHQPRPAEVSPNSNIRVTQTVPHEILAWAIFADPAVDLAKPLLDLLPHLGPSGRDVLQALAEHRFPCSPEIGLTCHVQDRQSRRKRVGVESAERGLVSLRECVMECSCPWRDQARQIGVRRVQVSRYFNRV